MEQSKCINIKLTNIPQEFINQYKLLAYTYNGWVYFEIVKGCYGLPQSGKLATDLIDKYFNKAGYFEAPTTSGL